MSEELIQATVVETPTTKDWYVMLAQYKDCGEGWITLGSFEETPEAALKQANQHYTSDNYVNRAMVKFTMPLTANEFPQSE